MLISLIVVILSQCIHISKYHIVHFKHIQLLLVSYTSIKLGGKELLIIMGTASVIHLKVYE